MKYQLTPGRHIASLDPGVTSGFCLARYKVGREFDLVQVRELKPADTASHLRFVLDNYDPEWIVVENFRLFKHAVDTQIGSEFPSVRLIGRVEEMLETRGIYNRLVLQMPNDRKSATRMPPEHARLLGSSPHTYAAYQHLRYFIVMNTQPIIGGRNA